MDYSETAAAVRRYFDELGLGEWDRLAKDIPGRVSLEVHRRFLRRFVASGARVLEVGAGPGRFTVELAALGCRVVVTDVSPVQLEANAERLAGTDADRLVERRELLDVCDVSRYQDGEFDAVLAFGGPLSYAFDRVDDALRGLLRVVPAGGVVVASVMSLLGSWRYLLPAATALAEVAGEDANDATQWTGDLRHVVRVGEGHVCQLFRWTDIESLVARCGGVLRAGSASNWASLGDHGTLAKLEADHDRWRRFLDHEVDSCAQPGARDGGTHILFAAARR